MTVTVIYLPVDKYLPGRTISCSQVCNTAKLTPDLTRSNADFHTAEAARDRFTIGFHELTGKAIAFAMRLD